jgi:hypothetical protein
MCETFLSPPNMCGRKRNFVRDAFEANKVEVEVEVEVEAEERLR